MKYCLQYLKLLGGPQSMQCLQKNIFFSSLKFNNGVCDTDDILYLKKITKIFFPELNMNEGTNVTKPIVYQ